jgi:EAL domain-containing protein (putative c-di-GMP-specific phosphodiesterase class I)
MRRAKSLGGGRCELFDEAMHSRAVGRLKLEVELLEAFNKREFRVCYHSVVDLNSKHIVGFEALLRWRHPEQGLISPLKFIDAAEDTGLLIATGQWLIQQASEQLRTWQKEESTREGAHISVNLSAKQFADAHLVSVLQSILCETGVDRTGLRLEMTEAVAAKDPALTIDVLSRLKHLGIGAILDDFGTGNSSFVTLRQFSGEALKIDRTLIAEMLADRGASETVDLIILLAHRLKMKVIAEGIETPKQLEHLRELGCDLGQGYLFSQPVDAGAASKLLSEQGATAQAKVAGA